jgi:hypothetical protein
VDAARSDPLMPRAQAAARTVQRCKQEKAARAKERRIRLREQQGPPPAGDFGELVVGEGRGREQRGTPSREVESPIPVTKGRRGGRGAGARRWAVSGGSHARRRGASKHHRGVGERSGGDDRRSGSASRTLEEEETGLLLF